MNTNTLTNTPGRGWNIAIWIGQILLALMFLMGAWTHGLLSMDELAQMQIFWPAEYPIAFVRLIAIIEVIGVLGLILPALTGIKPQLTVWAAAGLLLIQVLAIIFHVSRGEAAVIPFNFIYVVLAVFVLWGRGRKYPLSAKR